MARPATATIHFTREYREHHMTRTAIVTGASSGIGVAVSKQLVEEGYNVMMAARRVDRLEALAADLGERAAFRATDVTNPDDLAALVEATDAAFGQTDVLINNAGIMPLSPMSGRRTSDWDQMIDVNVRGVLHGIDAVLPQMIERKDGHIINVSSVAGLAVTPISSVYSATKFGVRAISDGLRQEMTAHNVRVTIVTPGGVNTELADSITDENLRAALEAHLTFDFLEPESIADAVVYALDQPASVCIGEIVIRPTGQA